MSVTSKPSMHDAALGGGRVNSLTRAEGFAAISAACGQTVGLPLRSRLWSLHQLQLVEQTRLMMKPRAMIVALCPG
jgi:hypothetical protein